MEQHEITLLITYDSEKAARPDKWDWNELLDLLPTEDVTIVDDRYVGKAYICAECGGAIPEEETVWIEPTELDIAWGMNETVAHHVECARNQY